jgi:alkylated DNA nucleotide flippase Atl1
MSGRALAVLDAVDAIPVGSAASYGEIGASVGVSARFVGRVLARFGDEVPWHRVVRADGTPVPHLAPEQLRLLRAEGAPLAGNGRRVDIRAARAGALRRPARGSPRPAVARWGRYL